MFRIICFVEDRALAAVLHAVSGLVKDLDVAPVANVVEKTTQVRARVNGNIIQLFAQYMDTHQGDITPNYVRDFQRSLGRSPGGYNNVLHKALQAKLIRKVNPKSKGTDTKYARNAK